MPDAVYGLPLPGVPVVPVPVELAPLFATAHRLVHRLPASAHLADGSLLHAVGPALDGEWSLPAAEVIDAVRRADRPVVLAGPGVVHARSVPGLHGLAAAAHLGVLNTWGAKGVFDWRSRHHLATGGLQERDFELGGLAEADLIVAVGIDPAEAAGDSWRLAPVVEVEPDQLSPLSEHWTRPMRPIAVPPLRAGLATVTQEGWASEATPIAPTRATKHLAEVISSGGLLAADAGLAGYWVARTFATTALGTVVVPAIPEAGLAIACAAVARLRQPARPVLAVVDGPLSDRDAQVLEAAAVVGAPVAVEAWHAEGDLLSPGDHRERLGELVRASAPTVATLALDPHQLGRMLDVAGPVVAWPALPRPGVFM